MLNAKRGVAVRWRVRTDRITVAYSASRRMYNLGIFVCLRDSAVIPHHVSCMDIVEKVEKEYCTQTLGLHQQRQSESTDLEPTIVILSQRAIFHVLLNRVEQLAGCDFELGASPLGDLNL